jgi:20S proteasome alpha/beta subunit
LVDQRRSVDCSALLCRLVALWEWAAGSPMQLAALSAASWLTRSLSQSMTMEQAETLALQTLKQVMEEKINSTNIEIAAVTTDTPFHIYTTEQVEALLTRL